MRDLDWCAPEENRCSRFPHTGSHIGSQAAHAHTNARAWDPRILWSVPQGLSCKNSLEIGHEESFQLEITACIFWRIHNGSHLPSHASCTTCMRRGARTASSWWEGVSNTNMKQDQGDVVKKFRRLCFKRSLSLSKCSETETLTRLCLPPKEISNISSRFGANLYHVCKHISLCECVSVSWKLSLRPSCLLMGPWCWLVPSLFPSWCKLFPSSWKGDVEFRSLNIRLLSNRQWAIPTEPDSVFQFIAKWDSESEFLDRQTRVKAERNSQVKDSSILLKRGPNLHVIHG